MSSEVPVDDARLLVAAQSGHKKSADALFARLLPLIEGAVRRVRPSSRADFRDDIQGEVLRMLVDPAVRRFDPSRGSVRAYLRGLVLNAARIITGQRSMVPGKRATAIDRLESIVQFSLAAYADRQETACFEVREELEAALTGEALSAATAARLHFAEGVPISTVAAKLGMNRFAVARTLDALLARSRARLALTDAA